MIDPTTVLPQEVLSSFQAHDVAVVDLEQHDFPNETHVVVYVPEEDVARVVKLVAAAQLKQDDNDIFVIVRGRKTAPGEGAALAESPVRSLSDRRCYDLVNLITARSRVSSTQPSLSYVPDARANLASVTAERHQLVFGRRGAGKTALLVEARRVVTQQDNLAAWVNVQTLRHESPARVTLYIFRAMLGSLITSRIVPERSGVHLNVSSLHTRIDTLLDDSATPADIVEKLIPRIQSTVQDYLTLTGKSLYVFLDDFYYIPRSDQPDILDKLHGSARDSAVWLKVASIRHLTRWWQASPPVGLQSGQDADIVDLDITLQEPSAAKTFLEGVLTGFANSVGIVALSRVFRKEALDRLVLASGAVPRDYLVLASAALARAQSRENARFVGVQEVNQVAGDAAAAKIQELEEDMAANVGAAQDTLGTLTLVRQFCLDETSCTYFLVDYRDREVHPGGYNRLTDLMDVRLLHMVNSGVSDAHAAGQRSEAFMLDLSQFTGARFKQRLRVLDFTSGAFSSRITRSKELPRRAKSAKELLGILRAAPTFSLDRLEVDGE